MPTIETSPPPDNTVPAPDDSSRLDGASRLRIFSVLAIIVLYTEVAPIQYTMVAAGLQKMSKTFSSVGGNINWAVIILGIVGAAAIPLLGKCSDIWGKKKIFLLCGMLFLIGCVICATTSDWTLFLVGRGLSALSLATQFIAYGLVRDLLPRKLVPVGLGVIGAGLGFSGVLAPVVGGILVDHFAWQAMFWFLAIYTVVLTPLVLFVVPETKLRVRERIDPFGAVLLPGGALLTLMYLDNGQNWGWTRPSALAWLIGGIVLLVAFVLVEFRIRQPLIDMRLLFSPKLGMVLVMVMFGTGITALMPLALGYMTQSPNEAGLRESLIDGTIASVHQQTGQSIPRELVHVVFDPGYSYGNGFGMLSYAVHIGIWAGIIVMVLGPIAGALSRRVGGRALAIISFVVLAAASCAFALTHYSWQAYLLIYLLGGIGSGFLYAAQPILIVEAVPAEQQGVSAGMLGVMSSMGSGVIIGITTALLNSNPVKAHIDVAGHSSTTVLPQVFTDRGYTEGFWVVAGTTLVALVIAIFMRHGRAPATGGAVETS
ncbi:MFS transporter [Nocardia sp. CA2R105]|uniref:MFS transporter n=1 Tax=Nocardia coffeae TaxID=2873381 RepID=UPI001CA73A36|nr:MFS transporter [Nocardia coffeae]MBY8861435.1 MFS transporter [Nocardia coffeae]